MGSHTKIIDFYGLPGCGKTTLVSKIIERCPATIRVANKRMAIKRCKLKFLISIRISDIINCVRYHFTIPKQYRRKDTSLWKFIKNYTYYRFISLYSDYDIVCMDNSIIQSIVSHQGGQDLLDNEKHVIAVKNLICNSMPITYVWCDVEPVTSVNRIHMRGRKKGRIDLMEDKNKQLVSLQDERELYGKFEKLLCSWQIPCIKINNNLSVDDEIMQLQEKMKQVNC